MENNSNTECLKFIEIKLNRDLCLTTDNPTQEYYYDDLLASQIEDPEEFKSQSTKRKLKEIRIGKNRHKEFNKMITERGINEREALRAIEDFSHLGDGYDKSDPFIDDREIFDECVPTAMRTKIEGFYINEGPVEYFFEDELGSDFTPKSKRKRKSKETGPNDTEEKVIKRSPKKTTKKENLTISSFLNCYIERWYHMLGYTANFVCGSRWTEETDPMEALFPLIPPTMDRAVAKLTDIFFAGPKISVLDQFIADSPPNLPPLTSLSAELSSECYKHVIRVLNCFLENMEKKRAQKRIDSPRKPDYNDSKILFLLYANCRRSGFSSSQWEKILEIIVTGLNMEGEMSDNVAKIRDYLGELVKYFSGAIDNILINKFVTDETLKVITLESKNDQTVEEGEKTKKQVPKIVFSDPQKNLIKTIFLLFLMALKHDKISGHTFILQINTFIKYFVKKLGGTKMGIKQSILLEASEFALTKVKKLVNKICPPKNDQNSVEDGKVSKPELEEPKNDVKAVETSAESEKGKQTEKADNPLDCFIEASTPSKVQTPIKIQISPPTSLTSTPIHINQSTPTHENSFNDSSSMFSHPNSANLKNTRINHSLSPRCVKIPTVNTQFPPTRERVQPYMNLGGYTQHQQFHVCPPPFIGDAYNEARRAFLHSQSESNGGNWRQNLYFNGQNQLNPREIMNRYGNNSVYQWGPEGGYNQYMPRGTNRVNFLSKRPPFDG